MITSFNYKGQEIKFEITDPNDYLQKQWLKGAFYEGVMLQFIEARWKKKTIYEWPTFIDVGACIGNHTVFFAKVLGVRVFSIEPEEKNSNLLWGNIELNGVADRVEPWLNFAAGENIGMAHLKLDESGNSGMHKVTDTGDVPVKMVTIDHIIGDHFKIDLIKIDVEGYNLPVLWGGLRTINQNHPEIYIECQTPAELEEVEDFLLPFGYRRWKTPFNATPTYFFYYK